MKFRRITEEGSFWRTWLKNEVISELEDERDMILENLETIASRKVNEASEVRDTSNTAWSCQSLRWKNLLEIIGMCHALVSFSE